MSVERGSNPNRVLIIGLDGATFDLAKPWIQEGELPTMTWLLENGTHGNLESTIQPSSHPAWTSFYTGKNPGKHSIFSFTRRRPGSYEMELLSGHNCRAKSLWRILGDQGKRVVVVNVPVTYPPEGVNGVLISGQDAPGIRSQFAFPAEIREEILAVEPSYKISLHLGGHLDTDAKRARAVTDLLQMADARNHVFQHLTERHPWDFAIVKFNSTDQVQHYFWRYLKHDRILDVSSDGFQDAILRIYRQADGFLGEYLNRIDDETTLIVLSDHGCGPHSGKVIFINEWLKRLGLLVPKGGDRSGGVHLEGFLGMRRDILEWTTLAARKYLPHTVKDSIQRLSPNIRSKASTYLTFAGIDWSRTKAYGAEAAGIGLNVKGREPEGIVDPDGEYEEIRDFIIAESRKLRDPDTKEPIVERIYKREEIYHGPYLKNARDLILVTKDHACSVNRKLFRGNHKPLVVSRRHPRGVNGKHRMNGMLMIYGRNIRRGLEIQGARIIDLAPTILCLMGVPLPDDMDGRVLTEVIEEPFLRDHPVAYEKTQEDAESEPDDGNVYSKDEEDNIKAYLSGLGYLE
jgi:predicted AlkP superfamily phosphohydrolase/phosphomutase